MGAFKALSGLGLSLAGLGAAAATPVPSSYGVSITFDPAARSVQAAATAVFDAPLPAGAISFDLHGELRVLSLEGPDGALPYDQEKVFSPYDYALVATRVTVTIPEDVDVDRLAIEYVGEFNRSRTRSPSDFMRVDNTGVYLRGYGYSAWFPIFVEPGADAYAADFDVAVTLPNELSPVLGGERVAQEPASGGSTTTRWRAADLSIFDAQIVARRYVEIDAGEARVFAVDSPESVAAGRRIADLAGRIGTALTRLTGNTPSSTLTVFQAPAFGDIASSSVVGLDDDEWRAFSPEGHSAQTLAHELSHGFVWVETPVADPAFALVREVFPSYFDLLALKDAGVDGAYAARIRRAAEDYDRARSSGVDPRGQTLPAEKPIYEISSDQIGLYKDRFVLNDRALLMLDHMRRTTGDPAFQDFWRTVFGRDTLTAAELDVAVAEAFPAYADDWRTWTRTAEMPARFSARPHE